MKMKTRRAKKVLIERKAQLVEDKEVIRVKKVKRVKRSLITHLKRKRVSKNLLKISKARVSLSLRVGNPRTMILRNLVSIVILKVMRIIMLMAQDQVVTLAANNLRKLSSMIISPYLGRDKMKKNPMAQLLT